MKTDLIDLGFARLPTTDDDVEGELVFFPDSLIGSLILTRVK